jgi:hypothetical protein
LTPEQRTDFDNVLHLLPTWASVLGFNCWRLVGSAKSDDADGLEKEVLLAEGAKVMLTHNLWNSKGW